MRFSVGLVLVTVGGAIIGATAMYFYFEVSSSSEPLVKRPAIPTAAPTATSKPPATPTYTPELVQTPTAIPTHTPSAASGWAYPATDTLPKSDRPENLRTW